MKKKLSDSLIELAVLNAKKKAELALAPLKYKIKSIKGLNFNSDV